MAPERMLQVVVGPRQVGHIVAVEQARLVAPAHLHEVIQRPGQVGPLPAQGVHLSNPLARIGCGPRSRSGRYGCSARADGDPAVGRGVRGDNPYALVDKKDRKPVKPLVFHSHDGRELGPDDMELVPAEVSRPARRN
ncbi:hypothetical protein J8F10_32195 [Gemmata sp. G18]|uniref:Uncharacterized protein n=1 Tax=Gemmata palustris TaxID=2822762 RepID=A0ABS5C1T5_9BACT|nr:hypothetical protein [Gemmata palustris]MBP3959929.1 hypothetical protein [Gemmata palustris]